MQSVSATVSLSSKLGPIDMIQIETRDDNRIASVLIRFSSTLRCKSFGAALKKAATGRWTDWKTTVSGGKEFEVRARWPGEQVLSASCGPALGFPFLRLSDAWTALPTKFRGLGNNAAGELVWNLVNNDVAASRAMNSPVTKEDVRGVTSELRQLIGNISNLKTLSPRSLDAFETFRAMAGS